MLRYLINVSFNEDKCCCLISVIPFVPCVLCCIYITHVGHDMGNIVRYGDMRSFLWLGDMHGEL